MAVFPRCALYGWGVLVEIICVLFWGRCVVGSSPHYILLALG